VEALDVPTGDGAVLHVTVDGSGPLFVLCHGGPGLWDYFDPLRQALRDVTRVVTWDQRGCGRSTGDGPHTISRYVQDLEDIRQALGAPVWVVGGHSWGASLALMYALAHPEQSAGVVYMSGTGLGREWNPHYHAESDRRRAGVQGRLDELSGRERTPEEEHEYRSLTWSSDFADPGRAVELASSLDRPFPINLSANQQLGGEVKTWSEPDLRHRCRSLDVPFLILHGDKDPRPCWAVDSLAAALPDAETRVFRSVGHVPWLEAPEEFIAILRRFLGDLSGTR